ncbi:hypothetical protein CYMTET_37775 [Cymbomonas tetramitiformis]|uniref:Feruloyl esterase n=1 Tax=Cymbomonas tetramitiformis TaxID=36881 RepID=A0AAE0CES0_9CHLO|nr:hypothetical protein CYMTET_37775 [Cymbomonas tetramitiformis]
MAHSKTKRAYELYVPTAVCDAAMPAPIVIALGCYGCSEDLFHDIFPLVDEYGFILVAPRGTGSIPSFNARYCCGDALHLKVDDVGFVKKVVRVLRTELEELYSSAVYGLGWSNGGYLVSLIAMEPDNPFKAIAPISGHQYDGMMNVTNPIPIFMHHSRNDAMVRYTGCCDNNTLPHCTDSITTDDQDQCIGADYVFNIWAAEINRCEMVGSIAGYELAYKDAVNDITCLSALGCSASSTLCTYGSHGHFRMHDEAPKFLAPRGTGRKRLKKKDRRSSAQEAEEAASLLDKAFPSEMMRAVFNFFGMEACTKGAKGKVGLFTQTPDHRHWCSCPRDGTFRGRYCLKEDAEQAGDANRTLGGSKMHSMNGTQRVHNRKSENEAHRMNDTHSANNTEQGADKTQTNAHNREQGARTLNGGQSAKDV